MSIDTHSLSHRAKGLLAKGPQEYLERHNVGLDDLYDTVTNPDGYIGLCEA